ncbi:MAG: adenine deaminase [Candidatus Acetothermia bacterium]
MAVTNIQEVRGRRLDLIKVVNGEVPADRIIENGTLVNVLTREKLAHDVVVKGKRIAYVGPDGRKFAGEGTEIVDTSGLYLAPGFLDAHLHIESSMLSPTRFARLVAGRGITTIFFDPHEIANVAGIEGVRWMTDEMNRTPVNGFLTVPSCIPASSTELETTGGEFGLPQIKEALGWDTAAALGEMMNFPGVLNRDEETIDKLAATADTHLPIEGHASGLTGPQLDGYVAAGVGSDHESVTKQEAVERARKGLWTYIREGSGWSDLVQVIKAITEEGLSTDRFCLVTDDRDPHDLLTEGGVDNSIRLAIEEGLDPVEAIRMATINPATRYRLDDEIGSIAPGRRADINLISNLEGLTVEETYLGGVPVGEIGWPETGGSSLKNTVNVNEITPQMLEPDEGGNYGLLAHKSDILTEKLDLTDEEVDVNDLDRLAVIERHRGTGNIGTCYVGGFNLGDGAIASTVAHDSHNLIVIGGNAEDMAAAANHLAEVGGGQTVVKDREVLATVELPIGGLMSSADPESVASSVRKVNEGVDELGCDVDQPLMILSSLALAVIPELRLTDKGLVDVNRQEII